LTLTVLNPLNILLWFFRRQEQDVANFYRLVTPYVEFATGTNTLNFGYWNVEKIKDLVQAQKNLCTVTGRFAELDSATKVIDVGSGFSDPAIEWSSRYQFIDNILCVDINSHGLRKAKKNISKYLGRLKENSDLNLKGENRNVKAISIVNATATNLPIPDEFVDRIVALESAQHFKPFSQFVEESYRILKDNGLLVLAIPVVTLNGKKHTENIFANSLRDLRNLGVLSLTWASEHYELSHIRSIILKENFKLKDLEFIGPSVYGPLADYYFQNRKVFQKRFMEKYRSYSQKIIYNLVEKIVYRSALSMKHLSEKGIIDYVLIKAER
jgi:ubiquinone/menaquinone biosynthesis C-methylase UbiE